MKSQIIVIIGHRGVGKSSLVKRIQHYDHEADFLDLDDEIEKRIHKKISEIFIDHGEDYFRSMEKQALLEILQTVKRRTYICTGAGLELDLIPSNCHVLWVRRATDKDGRIFLDRPRLDPEIQPLAEFKKRFEVREKNYRFKYTQIYDLPEGLFEQKFLAQDVEKKILLGSLLEDNQSSRASSFSMNVGGGVTLLPEFFEPQRWEFLGPYFKYLKPHFFELRNDLLTVESMQKAIEILGVQNCLFSFRRSQSVEMEDFFQTHKKNFWAIDWDYELGFCPQEFEKLPMILSCHNLDWSFLDKVPSFIKWVKFAPIIPSFADLQKGHAWVEKNPQRHQFVPRSENGRWQWYRLLQKNKSQVNFWRYGEGSAVDQPTLFEWMMVPENREDFFAAILGDPVAHSWTPLEQSDFFQKKFQAPVLRIQMAESEFAGAVPWLRTLGLRWAAVTSPLKLCLDSHRSVNTIDWTQDIVRSTSTDEQGFADLLEGLEAIAPAQSQFAVWGGGGTLPILKKVLPKAYFFSARTGQVRTHSMAETSVQNYNPSIVVWAAGSSADTPWPPEDWTPRAVVDLSYKEDSIAREYALKKGTIYISGQKMFESQAQGQRLFWLQK